MGRLDAQDVSEAQGNERHHDYKRGILESVKTNGKTALAWRTEKVASPNEPCSRWLYPSLLRSRKPATPSLTFG
jgi:hypothetical protein